MGKEKKELVPRSFLSNPAFRADVEALLKLSPGALSAIARLATGQEGFAPSEFAPKLAEEIKVPAPKARQMLRTAEYFYDRVSKERTPVRDAVEDLGRLAASLGVELTEEHRKALAEILAYKREYEFGRGARGEAISKGPHFQALAGSWSIKILHTREGEPVEVLVVGLTVRWHDSTGAEKEAFLLLTDKDWEEFKGQVEDISEERRTLDLSLRSRRGETE